MHRTNSLLYSDIFSIVLFLHVLSQHIVEGSKYERTQSVAHTLDLTMHFEVQLTTSDNTEGHLEVSTTQ